MRDSQYYTHTIVWNQAWPIPFRQPISHITLGGNTCNERRPHFLALPLLPSKKECLDDPVEGDQKFVIFRECIVGCCEVLFQDLEAASVG